MNLNFSGIKLTEGQQTAYSGKVLVSTFGYKIILCYSRQSGKSVLAEILLIENLCKPKSFNAYISPTFQLGRKVYKEITQLLENTGLIKKADSSTLTIETIYGSQLQFFSAEAYTAIRGFTVSGVLVVENLVMEFPSSVK